MILKFIEKIKSKPEPVKRSFTLLTSLGITSIVALFWVFSYVNYIEKALSADIPVESPSSFISRVSALVSESYASVKGHMKSVTEGAYSSTGTVSVDSSLQVDTVTSTSSLQSDITNDLVFATDTASGVHTGAVSGFGVGSAGAYTEKNNASSTASNVELDDILNTKNRDDKATTSSKLLIQ